MKPLSPHAKTLLRAYREGESLGTDARARVLARLNTRIAEQHWPPEGVDLVPPQPVTRGLLARGVTGSFTKLGLVVVALSMPAAWFAYSARSGEDLRQGNTPAAQPSSGQEALTLESSAGAAVRPEPLPADAKLEPPQMPPPPMVSRVPKREPEVAVRAAPPTRPARAAASSSKQTSNHSRLINRTLDRLVPTTSEAESAGVEGTAFEKAPIEDVAPPDLIDEEVRLLRQAHAAIRSGRPRDALAKLLEHENSFPDSTLGEARRVARMIALCDSGQSEAARAEARTFLRDRPTSPMADRVRALCTRTKRQQ